MSTLRFVKGSREQMDLRSFLTGEVGSAVLQRLVEMRDNNNNLKAVIGACSTDGELVKLVSERAGYVSAVDSLITMLEDMADVKLKEGGEV